MNTEKVYVEEADHGIELAPRGGGEQQSNHITADDQVRLDIQQRVENLTISQMVAEAILTLKPDFGGMESSDLESVASVGVPLVLLYYSTFVILLIYFTVIGIQNATAVAFLSLEESNADQTCVDKPQSVTGTFLGDFSGKWETDQAFRYNSSLFSIQFSGSSLDNEKFAQLFDKFAASMAIFGQQGTSRSVFYNAMVWSVFAFKDDDTNILFTSTVDASTLAFSQFMNAAAWSNRNGLCNATTDSRTISMSYNAATKAYAMNVPLVVSSDYSIDFKIRQTYTIPEPCPLHGTTTLFTDTTIVDGLYYQPNSFSLQFDVHTLFSIIALNLGVFSAVQKIEDRYIQTDSVFKKYVAAGYPGTFYVDELYVPMKAFFCIDKNAPIYNLNAAQIAGPNICFYIYEGQGPKDSVLLYPVGYSMHVENDHNGIPNNQNWARCECPRDMYARGCNRQDFHYMLFHRNNMSGPSYTKDNAWKMIQFGIKAQSFLVADPVNGDKTQADYFSRVVGLTAMVHQEKQDPNKVFHSHTINKNSQYTYGGTTYYGDYMNDTYNHGKTWNQLLQDEWDKICPDHACSGIYLNTLMSLSSNNFQSINNYNLQLGFLNNKTYYSPVLKGYVPLQMCVDTLSQAVAMKNFGKHPPVNLIQSYYECHNTVGKAATSAIGSAAGSANLYTNVIFGVLGVLVVLFVNFATQRKVRDKKLNRLLTPKEKELISQEREKRMHVAMIDIINELVKSNKEQKAEIRQLKQEQQSLQLQLSNGVSGGGHPDDVDNDRTQNSQYEFGLEAKLDALMELDPRKSTILRGSQKLKLPTSSSKKSLPSSQEKNATNHTMNDSQKHSNTPPKP